MEKNHKQKILMVHNYYQIPGGEDTVVANEKRLLEENGHIVILYTRHNNEMKSMCKLQKVCLPFTTIFNPRTYREIKRIIRDEDIEIVHVHNTMNLISPAVYYAAVKMKVPVLQTIHNFRFLCPGATFYRDKHFCEDCVTKGLKCAIKHKCYRGNRIQTLICVINTWIHRHTGILRKIHYITLTDFNKQKLIQLKQIMPEKVFVKPNFSFELLSQNNWEKVQRKYYLFVGRIEEIKGIHILVEAFRKMPDKELRLAGQGPLKQVYEGKEGNITFLGQVNHEELMKMIWGAKAVILSSQIYEGFPMIIPEAFSLYTPMIVGDIGNNGVLVKNEINGIKFQYDDENDIIRAINRFEKMDMVRLGENAYRDYKDYYSAEANYNCLSDIYNKVN